MTVATSKRRGPKSMDWARLTLHLHLTKTVTSTKVPELILVIPRGYTPEHDGGVESRDLYTEEDSRRLAWT